MNVSNTEDISGLPAAVRDRVLFLVKRAQRLLLEATEPVLVPLGLDNRCYTLLLLIDAEGPGSQQALGARLGVDRTTMVAVVDEAERGGFVARRRNPSDRRAYVVELTAAGRRALERARPAVAAAEQRVLGRLAAGELRQMIDALQRLTDG